MCEVYYGDTDHDRLRAYAFELITYEGVSALSDNPSNGKVATAAPINGFPAITATPPVPQQCYVAVDVADNEFLLATIRADPSHVSSMCDLVHQFAQAGMDTLLSRH